MADWNNESALDFLTHMRGVILNRAASGAAYKAWDDRFARLQVREAWEDSSSEPYGRRVAVVELCALSDDVLSGLGFGSWDGALRLIPLWAFNYIADGETLTSISGDTKTKGTDDIDLDVRFGCIAFGFKKPGAIPSVD